MFSRTRRLTRIFYIASKYGVVKRKQLPVEQRIKLALQELGPIFIKFGQALATRPDLISVEVADELCSLQDQVPAFAAEQAKKTIEAELKQAINALFADFSDEPLGSASIAQVHAATLYTGEQVVVKVLRPNIEAVVKLDIRLLYFLARWAKRLLPSAKQFRLLDVVAEVDKTLSNELDLMFEAANSSVLRRNFKNSSHLQVPKVYWDYSAKRVVTFERMYGTRIDNIEQLKAEGVDLQQIAKKGVELFFTQVFRDCYFHADMHPGNMFVNKNKIVLVDFGIMGTLTSTDQRYLAQNLLAFIKRDYRKVAELHIESGWVPADTRVNDFESALRAVCEPMFERPIQQVSFGKLLLRLFQTAQRFNMVLQPQLILLQKTILNIEGVARKLHPELNVWDTAGPVIKDWMRQRMGLKATLKRMKEELPFWSERLPELPDTIIKTLHKLSTEKL
jgi:ubiquinone biosynthesis protein